MNHLSQIETFITIVETGSLNKAAKKLCQTDAAISKKLSKLEDGLNTQLLERGRGIFQLTPEGEEYYRLCQDIMEKVSAAEEFIKQKSDIPQGDLRVTLNQFNAKKYIYPRLKKFLEKYPKIQLTLNIEEKMPDFTENKMDILFGVATEGDQDVVRKKLTTSRDILCATPQYLKKAGAPKKPKDLLSLDYICHNQRRPMKTIYFDDEELVIPKPILKLNDSNATIMAALEDIGYIYIKSYHVEEELADGKLIELLPSYNKHTIPVYIFYKYQEYLDPKIRAFMDYFVENKKEIKS